MERALYFTNFRNIGFNNSERLVLNYSLEKGKMGNLVIIVGANNSGKSNLLDGLYAFESKKILERDVTTLSYEEEHRKPQLSLVVKDEDKEFTYRITKGERDYIFYPSSKNNKWKFMDDVTKLKEELNSFLTISRRFSGNGKLTNSLNDILTIIDNDTCDKKEIETKILTMIDEYFTLYPNVRNSWTEYCRFYPNHTLAKEINNKYSKNELENLNKKFEERYGFEFVPNIVLYEEEMIKNSNIYCRIQDLPSNNFLKTVLSKIGITIEEIQNAYKTFDVQKNKGILTTLEKKINKLLDKVSKDFNNLYFADTDQYKFEISLETNNVYFSLFRGTKDISLDYQSTGFRWFFNLYFNLLSKTALKTGDIIIMDEPATHLHIKGRIELRKFLKEFAIKNDLTIVVTTHDPFLIDLDYLDELRVVSMNDNVSTICNDFTTVDIDDPDSLKPVKNALTVSNHILLDPDKNVVFVEGITDYNYLVGFKKLLNIDEDIVFLPIQGVGNVKETGYKEKQLAISKALIQIKKHNPILLVDADVAGNKMKVANEDSELNVVTLKEIDPNFKLIENLFDPKDLQELKLIKNNNKYIKHASISSIIKTFINEYKFSDTTKENFKKLFEFLINL